MWLSIIMHLVIYHFLVIKTSYKRTIHVFNTTIILGLGFDVWCQDSQELIPPSVAKAHVSLP